MKTKNDFIKILVGANIPLNEAKIEVELILEKVTGKKLEELLFINEFDEVQIMPYIKERIETKKPIQYILGYSYFMGEKFIVNDDVLIPRDETEILIREVNKEIFNGIKILDIGTGSGIIPCMIGKYSKEKNYDAEILGVDISNGAIHIALDNVKKLNLIRTCIFRKSDLFSNIRSDEKFDIIVSNPPYIPKKMYETIQEEVKFEPYNALFTDDDKGLYFYKKIIADAPKFLKKGGFIFFELMQGQADDVFKILSDSGFKNIQIIKDLANIERVIKAQI